MALYVAEKQACTGHAGTCPLSTILGKRMNLGEQFYHLHPLQTPGAYCKCVCGIVTGYR